jgi:hypothetical protein
MPVFELNRRQFLTGAGSLFLSSLTGISKTLAQKGDVIFASCVRRKDGSYGAVLLNEQYDLISEITLPNRGHDVIFSKSSNKVVIFARRPGNFAMVIDLTNTLDPQIITAPINRHFYGHGTFSHDGRLLYVSENDFEGASGKIGLYDATSDFNRIGEFDSFGIGPHEILLLTDNKTLAIANGGIETHPDFGRAKLNIAHMQSSITFVNTQDGSLVETHILPKQFRTLSLRHMVETEYGTVVFGGQYEGAKTDRPQLIGNCTLGEGIKLWELDGALLSSFANYTGSLAISGDKNQIAVSSPKGGVVAILEAQTGNVLSVSPIKRGNGLGYKSTELIATADDGHLTSLRPQSGAKHFDFAFDNHLAVRQ